MQQFFPNTYRNWPELVDSDSIVCGLAKRKNLREETLIHLQNIYQTPLDPDLLYLTSYALACYGKSDDLNPVLNSKGIPPREIDGDQNASNGRALPFEMCYEQAIRGLCDSESLLSIQKLKKILPSIDELPEIAKCVLLSRKKNRFFSEIPILNSYLKDDKKNPKIRSAAAKGLGICAEMIRLGTIN